MPRPKRWRKVSNPPIISGFKPYGSSIDNDSAESIFLRFEEYEAIRLCDYEGMNHHEASMEMQVSRPTLTRIYAIARQKIAEAFVMGKQIIIEGGKIYFDSDWYNCHQCGSYFNRLNKQEPIIRCPLCNSDQIASADQSAEYPETFSNNGRCTCPICGFSKPHVHGMPCKHEICPHCHGHLRHS
ncbi:DUF134 domain-containing protein [Microbacter margulisiae]|uniref:UPF0251 protein FHX64_000226 n=1 Tax=Microbacter margulisiae TaxID=1350067 RepID=A0A7W5H019_9PORP|nr:DUF134 domain-containing protein [Microbacter margulisiae]MBB3186063.1 putative DNA-binding protein (UPF0251 family) [Microbacter margulisiae]